MPRLSVLILFLITVALAAGIFFLSLEITQLDQKILALKLTPVNSTLPTATGTESEIKSLKASLKELQETQDELATTIAGLPSKLREELSKSFAPAPLYILERPSYEVLDESDGKIKVKGHLRRVREWLERNALFLDQVLEKDMVVGFSRTLSAFVIKDVQPLSPFGQMGLRAGDVITSIDGAALTESSPVRRLLLTLPECQVELKRDEAKISLQLIYGNDQGGVITLDITRAELDAVLPKLLVTLKMAPSIKGGKIEGVKIIAIEPANPLALMDFQAEDIITHINGEPVSNKTFLDAIQNAGEPLEFDFIRDGTADQITIKFTS